MKLWPILLLVGAMLLLAQIYRYDIKINDGGGIVRLDRWTGTVAVCNKRAGCVNVEG